MDVGDLHDWEVLHASDEDESKCFDCIDGGAIKSDYFSLDSQICYKNITRAGDIPEDGASVDSNNPSWIDPGSDTRSPRREFTEFWPDSGSDQSDDHKFGEFEVKNELGFVENEKSGVNSDGLVVAESENSGKFWSDLEAKNEEFVDNGVKVIGEKDDVVDAKKCECVDDVIGVEKSAEGEKRVMVWWKLPLELLKYCMFRINPVWTVPMAAAMMGFVILGRRYYKMKRKSKSMHLKVTVDDQKVSQFMNRVAQLNEAFSVVKRVPIIRPQLPAAGVTPWPAISR